MSRTIVQLKNPEHWIWKTNKNNQTKIKIKSKLKKWLKKHCKGAVIMRTEMPPSVWLDKEKFEKFNKEWM